MLIYLEGKLSSIQMNFGEFKYTQTVLANSSLRIFLQITVKYLKDF